MSSSHLRWLREKAQPYLEEEEAEAERKDCLALICNARYTGGIVFQRTVLLSCIEFPQKAIF